MRTTNRQLVQSCQETLCLAAKHKSETNLKFPSGCRGARAKASRIIDIAVFCYSKYCVHLEPVHAVQWSSQGHTN